MAETFRVEEYEKLDKKEDGVLAALVEKKK